MTGGRPLSPDPAPSPGVGEPTRHARLMDAARRRNVPLATIVVTVAVVVAVYLAGKLLYRLREVVVLFLVAAFITVVLNPLVDAVIRWKIRRRGVAVAVVTVWALLVFAGLAVLFGYPLVNGITHLANRLPNYITQAEHGRGWIGHIVRKYHILNWIKRNSPKLVNYAQSLSKPALSVGKGALSLLFALATLFVLVVLMLLEAPRMHDGVLRLMSPERGARYSRVGREVRRAVSGYMLGDFITSLIAGLVVFITLLIVGVPFPFLWALWVALVDFLPLVGGALAGIPTVLFAFTHSITAGIVTAVVFVAYTQIENHVLNPVVMSRTVRVNPLLVFLAVLVGAEIGSWIGGLFGGFVAALLAIPAAGATQVMVREVWRSTGPADPEPVAPPPPVPPAVPAESGP